MCSKSYVRLPCVLALLLSVAGCSNPEKERQRYVQSGDQFVADKKFAEAIVEYRNAVRVDERSGEARYKLAEAYAQTGEARGAYQEYLRAADLMPDNADAQIKAVTYLSLAGQFEDARTRVQRLLDKQPQHVEAQILLGTVLAGLKDLDGAVSQIEEAIQIDPARGSSYTNLGMLQLAKGDRDAARAAFDKAVSVDPRSVPARLALAMFQLQTGDTAAAEASLKTALEIDPHHQLGNRAMATLYMATNRAAAAEPHLKTLAADAPTPQAKFALADYYLALGRKDEATATLTPLANQDATFADAKARLAQIAYASGDVNGAHAILDGVLARSAQHTGALLTKARWLRSEGKRADALVRAQAAVKAAPEEAAAHFMLGSIQSDLQDVQGAVASFNEVLRINPRVAAAQIQLSRLQLAQGATKEAVRLAESALQNAPANPEARLQLAGGLVAQRDFSRADPMIAELLKQYPKVAAVQALDGMRYLVKQNLPSARAAYERALQLDTTLFSALSGLTAIDMLEKKPAAALARVEQRLTTNADNVPLLLLASRVYLGANQPAKAEQSLRRVLDLAPADNSAYALLGQLYISQQRMDEAQKEFDTLATRNPKHVGFRTVGAVISHTKNSLDDAKKRYKEILEIDSSAVVAANNLAWLYAEEGQNLDEALRLAQMAASQAPDRADIQDTIGWIYYKKELPALAIPPFEKSIKQEPGNAGYHYHLAMAYAKSGDSEQARRAVSAALSLRPDYREAKELQATLSR